MRSVTQWLDEYGAGHRHPVNKTLHWICVPLIVLSVIGLISCIPVPGFFGEVSPWLTWATLGAIGAVLFYFSLSVPLALGSIIAFVVLFAALHALGQLPFPLWQSCAAIFVLAWIGQFIGHAIEGKQPSFFQDLVFLLIGPLWLLAFVFRRFGWRSA